MLTKRVNGVTSGPRLKQALAGVVGGSMDRRTFLKRSGIAAGGVTAVSLLPIGMVKAQTAKGAAKQMQIVKSVCTHCSAGRTVLAAGRHQPRRDLGAADVHPDEELLGHGRILAHRPSHRRQGT